ncbi:hypothetical protein ACQ0MK_17005 [Thalassospira lucentensis]|uniref:hypothetical protein n=1 Tax=Thalassospira lucentensis TaxID=168935 RepID=UPI003D2EFD36
MASRIGGENTTYCGQEDLRYRICCGWLYIIRVSSDMFYAWKVIVDGLALPDQYGYDEIKIRMKLL